MARRTTWVTTNLAGNTVPSGGQFLISLATNRSVTDSRSVTIVRTLVHLQFASLTGAGAYAIQSVHWGIGIASQEAFAAGVVPDPNTPGDQPTRGWLARGAILTAQNGVGGQVVYGDQVDIRSARKLDEGEPYLVINSNAETATTYLTLIGGHVRQLWMLP